MKKILTFLAKNVIFKVFWTPWVDIIIWSTFLVKFTHMWFRGWILKCAAINFFWTPICAFCDRTYIFMFHTFSIYVSRFLNIMVVCLCAICIYTFVFCNDERKSIIKFDKVGLLVIQIWNSKNYLNRGALSIDCRIKHWSQCNALIEFWFHQLVISQYAWLLLCRFLWSLEQPAPQQLSVLWDIQLIKSKFD